MMRCILLLVAGWIAVLTANAQEAYPIRPIRIVVAYPPGGSVDLMARTVALKLQESFGQPVSVENRPGGNAVIGALSVMKAAPDGYTLLVIDRGSLTINPSLYKSPPYDSLKDFAYIGVSSELHYVLAVNASFPANSFKEFVQLAKSKQGSLNYGSFGTGSITHLNFEQMNSFLGIQMTHVPYKGATETSLGVIGGDVAMMMSSFAGVSGFLGDGRMRALAVSGPKRLAQLPNVPTVSEAGGGSNTMVPTYFTFVAPAGTPRAVIAKLNAEIGRVQLIPEVVERLSKAGLEPRTTTPDAFVEEVKRDIERFGTLVKKVGIPLQ
jgi:tripartite-type tricarboxylate transporter receptor subunit TctC